jgi:adenine C2-methylase RlmN of 23S rRNA A2503 and tRNA A37
MTNLPKPLRKKLAEHFSLHTLELVHKQGASDETQKFLWRLHDHALIESVLIPANPALYGEASDRHTLCISTQVGCAYGCKFCASGLDGWKRNLTPDEIVEQVLSVERLSPQSTVGSPESTVRHLRHDHGLETVDCGLWTMWWSWAWVSRWQITSICSRRSKS